MTRRDYYLIAGALAKCKSLGQENLLYVADMVATDLQKDNPAFKPELFLRVAGAVPDPYIVTDEESSRFNQTGQYLELSEVPGSKPYLHCHTIAFADGAMEDFLSYQIMAVRDNA